MFLTAFIEMVEKFTQSHFLLARWHLNPIYLDLEFILDFYEPGVTWQNFSSGVWLENKGPSDLLFK